jgi:excisionase family DNA binding protein
MEDMLYTVKEAAALLKCNENTVNSLINSGMLKCLILGRRKIPRAELLRFLESNLGKDVTDPFHPKAIETDVDYKY